MLKQLMLDVRELGGATEWEELLDGMLWSPEDIDKDTKLKLPESKSKTTSC